MSDDGCYCETGEGDPPEWMNTTQQRARKEYKCFECREPIKVGDLYARTVGKWDGEILTFRLCDYCHQLSRAHLSTGAEFAFGDLACVAFNNPALEPSESTAHPMTGRA